MTRDEFWALVEQALSEDDADETAENLRQTLVERGDKKLIYAFMEQQARVMERSYTWKLWGAAYILNGGCSDDGFDYFRGWLIAQGRAVFEAVLTDPDSLADMEVEEVECEDMISAASTAYFELDGEYPDGPMTMLPALGDSWDFDDAAEMRTRYPRLWEEFGWD